MATKTMTMPKHKLPKNLKLPPENERYMRACSDIANALIQDYEAQRDDKKSKKDINLNKLRGTIAKKHYLSNLPPLTAIIAAVPEHYKKYILPKLIAKPISEWETFYTRVASCMLIFPLRRNIIWNRRRCGDVQASSLSAYCIYRKYLRLLSGRP